MPSTAQAGIVLTHHKCASTWLDRILEGCCAAFKLSLFRTHLSNLAPPRDQHVDLLLFTNSDYEFCSRHLRPWLDSGSGRIVHVIRNPLDLLVSAYYSHLSTHPLDGWPELAQQRSLLQRLDKEAGMRATWAFLERSDFYQGAVGPLFALRRWNFDDQRIKTLRMEDLVGDYTYARAELQTLLGEDPAGILSDLTFDKLSGGRPRGMVDHRHHFRSGASHQWLHEIKLSLARAVHEKYQLLMDTFYPEVDEMLRSES